MGIALATLGVPHYAVLRHWLALGSPTRHTSSEREQAANEGLPIRAPHHNMCTFALHKALLMALLPQNTTRCPVPIASALPIVLNAISIPPPRPPHLDPVRRVLSFRSPPSPRSPGRGGGAGHGGCLPARPDTNPPPHPHSSEPLNPY